MDWMELIIYSKIDQIVCPLVVSKIHCDALVYESSKIKIYIYHLNNEELFVNFFILMSFMPGNFANHVKMVKRWLLDAHILMYRNCSIIFETNIIMEGTRFYLTLCTTCEDTNFYFCVLLFYFTGLFNYLFIRLFRIIYFIHFKSICMEQCLIYILKIFY